MPAPREDLRLSAPTLEPDPALVARLAAVAAAGRATTTRRFAGLRVGVATAGLVAVSVGGAWAAATWVTPQPASPPMIQPPDSGGSTEPGDTPDTPGSNQVPPPGRPPSSGWVGDLPDRAPERGPRGLAGAHRPSGHGNDKGQGKPGNGHGAGQSNGVAPDPGVGQGSAPNPGANPGMWGWQNPDTTQDRRDDGTSQARDDAPVEGSEADRVGIE